MARRRPLPAAAGVAAAVLLLVATLLVVSLDRGAPHANAATTTGCGRALTMTSGTYTISSGGQNRTYILRVPDNYQINRAYRLVFGLHWLNGSASAVANNAFYGLQRLSNNSTIFVAPQGIDNGWANSGGRDVTLIDDIMRQVEGALCVETTQRFALGWSYGGAMSYALACSRPTVFRAVAALSGANLSGCSGGTQPVAYFGLHGTHDSVLNISSGRALRDTFVRNNGCTPQSPPEPPQGSLTHITTTYSGCRTGYPVQWAAFDGDHTPSPVDGSPNPSDTTTWTSGAIWTFFSQFQTGAPSSPPATVTPSPTTPRPTTPPAGGSCGVSYAVTNQWTGGFGANVTITNRGAAISSWRLTWAFGAGQTITQLWNGSFTQSGGQVTVTNASYNGSIPSGSTTSFGFNGSWTSSNPAPASFALNGVTCT